MQDRASPLAFGHPAFRRRPVTRRSIRRGMQLWGHVRRSAPLRGPVRRRRAPEEGGASLGAAERPRGRAFSNFGDPLARPVIAVFGDAAGDFIFRQLDHDAGFHDRRRRRIQE